MIGTPDNQTTRNIDGMQIETYVPTMGAEQLELNPYSPREDDFDARHLYPETMTPPQQPVHANPFDLQQPIVIEDHDQNAYAFGSSNYGADAHRTHDQFSRTMTMAIHFDRDLLTRLTNLGPGGPSDLVAPKQV